MFARGSGRYLLPAFLALAISVTLVWAVGPVLWTVVAFLGVVTAFMLWFFRDPERAIGPHVVSPADGKVLAATQEGERVRLTIFMTPVSVHVNRSPLDARIEAMMYHQGGHVPAFNKESDRNERLELDLSTPAGPVRVRLIAGTVARRIHPYLDPGAQVKKGDRIGLIAFGSRCELLLPGNRYRLIVAPGDWVKAGSTPVAHEVS